MRQDRSFFNVLSPLFRLAGHADKALRESEAIRAGIRTKRAIESIQEGSKPGRMATIEDINTIKDVRLTNEDHGFGILIGMCGDQGLVSSTEGSIACYGKPRSGKGTTLIYNHLAYSIARTNFVVDLKSGENAYGTSRYRQKHLKIPSYHIAIREMHGLPNSPLNPLRGLIKAAKEERGVQHQAMELAAILIPYPPNNAHQWVQDGARKLFACYMEYLSYFDPDACNLVSLWHLVNSSQSLLAKRLNDMVACKRASVSGAANQILNMVLNGEESFTAIQAEASNAISPFEPGKDLAKVVVETPETAVDWASLKKNPGTVYIMAEPDELIYASKWVTLVMSYLIETLAIAPGDVPVTFLVDEFPQLPKSPVVPKAVKLYSGYKVNFWFFSQGRHSLTDQWSESVVREIEDHCAIVQFWGVTDTKLMDDIEKMSGQTSVYTVQGNYSGGAIQQEGLSVTEHRRAVLQSGDIQKIGDNKQLLKFSTFPYLVEADRVPWYELSPYNTLLTDARPLFEGIKSAPSKPEGDGSSESVTVTIPVATYAVFRSEAKQNGRTVEAEIANYISMSMQGVVHEVHHANSQDLETSPLDNSMLDKNLQSSSERIATPWGSWTS